MFYYWINGRMVDSIVQNIYKGVPKFLTESARLDGWTEL